jgi:internalin A
MPYLWDDNVLRSYLGEIRRRHGIVETLAMPSMRDLPPVQIETLFVSPLLAEQAVSSDTDPETWPSGRSLIEELVTHERIVVLGDPGGGKTTLSNWLAWRLSSGLSSSLPAELDGLLPVPCVLRNMPVGFFSSDVTVADLAVEIAIHKLGSKAGDKVKESLRARVSSGQYILILDGVDEIPVSHRKTISKWMQVANQQGAYVLATSRIIGYEDGPIDCDAFEVLSSPVDKKDQALAKSQFEELNADFVASLEISRVSHSPELLDKSALSISQSEKWALVRFLMPFDQSKIAAFAENWYRQRCGSEHEAQQRTSDLLASLSQSEVTQQLARTPNLLSLMAIVHRERAHLPDGKALLYEEIANAYINTIDRQRKIVRGDVLAAYGWKERKAWLAYVGFRMQQNREQGGDSGSVDEGILVDEKDVEAWLVEVMEAAGVESPEASARTFLSWVARRCGLLLPRAEGRYAFVHLSFQEYFCACYLDSCIVRPAFIRDKLAADALVTKRKLREWGNLSVWSETLIFLFELLSSERDSDWVEDLAAIVFENDQLRLSNPVTFLSARVLRNRHIRLGTQWRDKLADNCSWLAFHEWQGASYYRNPIVLISLIDAGYAAVIGTFDQLVGDFGRGVSERALRGSEEIKELKKIRVLIVYGLNVPSVKFLSLCEGLKYLALASKAVEDISSLERLVGLEVLHLEGLPIKDFGVLSRFESLKTLRMRDLEVEEFGFAVSLKNLSTLSLERVVVSDLSALKSLTRLMHLSLVGVSSSAVESLRGPKQLMRLTLDSISKPNLGSLRFIKDLYSLDLNNIESVELDVMGELKKLRSVFLCNVGVKGLINVAPNNQISTLFISSSKLTDFSLFQGFVNLSTLVGISSGFSDLSDLKNFKKLKVLNLRDTKIKDVAPLACLCDLEELNVSHTDVIDLSPTYRLKKLRRLDVSGLKVRDLSFFENRPGLLLER